jgi:hypothetical protein
VSPTFPQPDTPIPLPTPPPQEALYIAIPLQLDSPAYVPTSLTELSHSPTPNPVAELIQTFLAEAEDNTTPPASPSAIPLPIYASPTLCDPSPLSYDHNEPQPGMHPRFLWNENSVDGVLKFPQFTITDGNNQYPAPFYHINMDNKYPTVSVTEGCNCPVHSVSLHAQPHPYLKPLLTQKEEFMFHDRECFTPLINKALHMDRDVTLQAEVVRYQRAMAEVHSLTSQLVSMKRKFDDVMWDMQNSGKRLAMVDTYGRLEPHVLYRVQVTDDITAKDIEYSIQQVVDPWEQGPNYENATCEWCLKRGHHTTQCYQLTHCKLCLGRGHNEELCCHPHR